MKACSRCAITKARSDFYSVGKGSSRVVAACKECTRAYMNEHRKENYERVKGYTDRSRMKYRENNLEKTRETQRKWNARNRDSCREKLRKWRKDNPGKDREYVERRRARKLGNGGQIDVEDWLGLCSRFDNRCLCCGRDSITMDHIKPLSRGGRHEIDNVQPLCQSCNSRKGVKHIDYRVGKAV